MNSTTPPTETELVCSECGQRITGDRVVSFGEPKAYLPFFCSRECASKYDPNVLTKAKLSGFRQWFGKPLSESKP